MGSVARAGMIYRQVRGRARRLVHGGVAPAGLHALYDEQGLDRLTESPDPKLDYITRPAVQATGADIGGIVYPSAMPPFASSLSDTDIAAIINFERTSWGNHGSLVTAAQVAAERAKGK